MDLTGQPAPDFALPRDGGGICTLSGIEGPVVLFFYPRADTPGCTTEALEFTTAAPDFQAAGAAVLGISKDPVSKQDAFRDKHALGIALLSDADGDVSERYGTWTEKKMFGKTSMGVERSTFLIGANRKILHEWRKVKVPGHVDEVLAVVRRLTG